MSPEEKHKLARKMDRLAVLQGIVAIIAFVLLILYAIGVI